MMIDDAIIQELLDGDEAEAKVRLKNCCAVMFMSLVSAVFLWKLYFINGLGWSVLIAAVLATWMAVVIVVFCAMYYGKFTAAKSRSEWGRG